MEITIQLEGTIVFNKIIDVCDKKPKPELVKPHFAIIGIPTRCPITKNFVFCNDASKPLVKFSDSAAKFFGFFMSLNAQGVTIRVNITHDTGSSCFEAEHKVIRN
jgi:hypothetical protein